MSHLVYWDEACTYLRRRDKILGKIIRSYEGEILVSRGDAFYTLARSIAGQQISVKAADTIWKRLEAVTQITPQGLAAASENDLRAAGLSSQKVTYMRSLAQHFTENAQHIKHWSALDDEALIKELTSIKGIGRWTAEMYLIFHMGRPDIFPIADIGLQKAMFRHYTAGNRVSTRELKKISEKWTPYRSVATWYLWRSLDPIPVAY